MTEALERALAPLLTFGSFFGLGMFEYPRGQPRAYLSCLYVLAKWGSLMYFYYYPYLKRILHVEKAFDIQIINLVLINTLILISLCRFKELKMCLRELAIIDDTLEALGAPKEYQRLLFIDMMIRIAMLWCHVLLGPPPPNTPSPQASVPPPPPRGPRGHLFEL
ncbi:hypothetical protein G5I_09977 [Acromyrmex echinatior]|uniref:Uncharacterized protein n=1 Tax=Acromyrmex echinatior TaxID=103372 RepID=F4WVN0_ACREC|nr:hypothetical protein G5I_09977 [Acromyrmex echinatior]